ncbi:MAG TPA: hypothetical protein VF753_05420 [Terriglobales bacterium]
MTYFDCFLIASWMSVIGWFIGAIFAQNGSERVKRSRPTGQAERTPAAEAWQFGAARLN